jgi:hypothetical protein
MKPNQCNNGNIEISHPETTSQPAKKEAVDEVLINGRRYRIPERIILLDFWNKIGGDRGGGDRCESFCFTPYSCQPFLSVQ